DYGYPDGSAFLEVFQHEKPLIINFDAHLDVRNLEKGLTSGTAFFRLLEEVAGIDFYEIGVQPQCNSEQHWTWLLRKGGHILSLSDIQSSPESFARVLAKKLNLPFSVRRPTFVSIDIDAFCN